MDEPDEDRARVLRANLLRAGVILIIIIQYK